MKIKYVCYSNSRDANEEKDDISAEYLHFNFRNISPLSTYPFNYHVRLAHFRAEKNNSGKNASVTSSYETILGY